MAIGLFLVVLLIHLVMGTSAGRYLRQMGDTDHLTVTLAHLLHYIRHTVGYFTGHTGVYFIEYNGGKFHSPCYHCLDGQHDTGYLTAGSH